MFQNIWKDRRPYQDKARLNLMPYLALSALLSLSCIAAESGSAADLEIANHGQLAEVSNTQPNSQSLFQRQVSLQSESSPSQSKPTDSSKIPDSTSVSAKSGDKSASTGQVPVSNAASGPAVEKTKRANGQFLDVLPTLTWVDPDHDPKAVLFCIHGLGLNNRSYIAFGEKMSKLGYLVYAVDVPGFGSFKDANQGRDRIDFDYCLKGISDTLRLLHKVNRKLPVFVLGESMGGAIALRITSEHPELVDGLISSVPSGDRFNQGKETLRVGLKLLTAPNKPFDIGSDVIKRATQDDELRTNWAGDTQNRMDITPKELLRFQNFMNENHDSAHKISSTPVMFVQGCKDQLVKPEGTVQLFNAIACPDRQMELIHDKEHLIFEEGQFDDHVIGIVDKWLTAHIESGKLTKK